MATVDFEQCIEAHAKGDPHAFERLFETVRGDLWGYLVNNVRKTQDAEDLYQDISLKAFRHLADLRNPAGFRSWIFAIAVNSVRSFFRRKTPPLVGDEETLQMPDHTPNPAERLEQRLNLLHLREAVQDLPEQDRQILLLATMADLPQQEIADQLDLNLNTVKTKLRRAKIKLARRMMEVSHV